MKLLDWIGEARPVGARIAPDVQYFGNGPLLLGPYVRIDTGCVLLGSISIGKGTHLAPYCLLYGRAGIRIGDLVNIGAFGVLHSESESFTGEFPMGPQWAESIRRPVREPVRLGNRSTLGTRTTVLPGVVVGEGSIVGAHSLVRASIPPFEKWAGTPAMLRGFASKGQMDYSSPL